VATALLAQHLEDLARDERGAVLEVVHGAQLGLGHRLEAYKFQDDFYE